MGTNKKTGGMTSKYIHTTDEKKECERKRSDFGTKMGWDKQKKCKQTGKKNTKATIRLWFNLPKMGYETDEKNEQVAVYL